MAKAKPGGKGGKRAKKGLHALTFRDLHHRLQSPEVGAAKDVRVSSGASRALQEQLIGIAEHLIREVRARAVEKERRHTVLEQDVVAVYEEFIRPRKLASLVATALHRLGDQITSEAEAAAAEFKEGKN